MMKPMRKSTMAIMSIGLFALAVFLTSCEFMAGMATGAAYGLANSAYYYGNSGYNSNYSSGTYTSSSTTTTTPSIEKTLQTESDGFSWYELEQGDKRGAQSASGTTLIPLSRGYTFICYHTTDGGWFSTEKHNQGGGACDKNGKEIVAPGRYDNAYYRRNDDGYEYCRVTLNGKDGICDMNGREIIAPRYESLICSDGTFEYKDASGNWVSTGVSLNNSSGTNHASTTTTTTTTSSGGNGSSGSSSGSDKGKLLYEGRYTETEHRWPAGNTMEAFVPSKMIKIYEDKIEVYDIYINQTEVSSKPDLVFRFISIQNGKRVYSDSNVTAVVGSSFNISCNDSFGASFQYVKEGSSSTMPQGGYYGGGDNYGGYNSGSSGTNGGNSGNTQTSQPKQHKCGVCGGSGRVVKTDGPSFGNTKYCSECGRTVPDNHYHTTCPSCKGKGWW